MIPPLLGITPGDARPLDGWLRDLGGAGLPGVLIREPDVDAATLERLVALACDVIPWVAVHARHPHAAAVAERFGLPLHVADGAPAPAGPFGASTHAEDGLDAALRAGARYCLLSPVWSPASKPDDRRSPLGPDRFLAAARGRPVYALGGVTPDRWRRLRDAGARAAILGPLAGPDPTAGWRPYRS